MKLPVTGIETIEITDPKGVCEKHQQAGQPSPIEVFRSHIPKPVVPPAEIGWSRHYDPNGVKKWQVGLTGDPPGTVTNMPYTGSTAGEPTTEKWGKYQRKAYGNGD